jgi:hypothetical protein
LWLELGRFGISSENTRALGLSMAAVTVSTMLLILRSESWPGSCAAVLTLLSPSILFGIERGNVDTLLFAALVFGLFATRSFGASTQLVLRAILIVGLTVLKAYPVAACSIFLNQSRRGWLAGLSVGCIAVVAFAWLSWERIPYILSNTPLTSFYSFGAASLFLDLGDRFAGPDLNRSHVRWLATGVALGLGLMIAVWVAVSRPDVSSFLPQLARGQFRDDLCLAGLAIFSFCFLLGSNYNYRLIFLAGALPKLIAAYDETQSRHYLLAPAAIIALLWGTRLPSIVDHALNWFVFALAGTWIAEALIGKGTQTPSLPTSGEALRDGGYRHHYESSHSRGR